MKLLALALAGTLAGCATTQWVHPTGNAKLKQDTMECSYEAKKATAGIRDGFQAGWEQGALERQCMEVRGYRQQRVQ